MILLYVTICFVTVRWCTPEIQSQLVFQSDKECSEYMDRVLDVEAGHGVAVIARCEAGT
jgi:hypothetical protein